MRVCVLEVHCVVCYAELQAAGRIHRDPAPVTQHGQGLLEAGVRLRMHLHRHAERDRFGSGEVQNQASLIYKVFVLKTRVQRLHC